MKQIPSLIEVWISFKPIDQRTRWTQIFSVRPSFELWIRMAVFVVCANYILQIKWFVIVDRFVRLHERHDEKIAMFILNINK